MIHCMFICDWTCITVIGIASAYFKPLTILIQFCSGNSRLSLPLSHTYVLYELWFSTSEIKCQQTIIKMNYRYKNKEIIFLRMIIYMLTRLHIYMHVWYIDILMLHIYMHVWYIDILMLHIYMHVWYIHIFICTCGI